ncbi:MAG TPA: PASTA domain-containing protein [Longimicrobiales bacterium]
MSWRLGDSIRRRHAPVGWRPTGAARWLGIAFAAGLLAFGTGYAIAALVLFPAPAETGAGIPVPGLAGRRLEEAERQLRERGLEVGDVLELPHPDRPAGVVVAQSPLPGQQLRAGARVSLGVSSGPPRARVPDVTGLTAERAAKLAGMAGFEVSRREEESEAPAGTVIRVEPAPGTEHVVPAPLVLVVSSGPPLPPPDMAAGDSLARDAPAPPAPGFIPRPG